MRSSEHSLSAYHVLGVVLTSSGTTQSTLGGRGCYSHLRDRETEAQKGSVTCLNSSGWATESAGLPTLPLACLEHGASNPGESRAGIPGFLSALCRSWLAGGAGESESHHLDVRLGKLPENSWLTQILRSVLFGLSSRWVSPSTA